MLRALVLLAGVAASLPGAHGNHATPTAFAAFHPPAPPRGLAGPVTAVGALRVPRGRVGFPGGSDGRPGMHQWAASRVGRLASLFTGAPAAWKGVMRPKKRRTPVGPQAMFTGIVEEIGEVDEMLMDIKTPGVTLTLKGDVVLDGAYEGCSISVNGVCLTVTEFKDKRFTVGVSPETLRLTNLGELIPKSKVNLERAAAMDGRNSGHVVQGHVDDVGEIVDSWPDEESLFFKVKVPQRLMQYIVPKGFIAIDGTSLTVCETNTAESWFTFMLVDYTQKHVIIPSKKDGGKVNIEVDVMSKYVENAMKSVNERLEKLEAKVFGDGA